MQTVMEFVFICWEHVAEENSEVSDYNITFLLGKENAAHIYKGFLFNQKGEQNHITYIKMVATGDHDVRKTKPDSVWKILHALLYA